MAIVQSITIVVITTKSLQQPSTYFVLWFAILPKHLFLSLQPWQTCTISLLYRKGNRILEWWLFLDSQKD